jgi:O-antigen/teichoic acid export membrane protein
MARDAPSRPRSTSGLPERFGSGTGWSALGFASFAIVGIAINIIIAAAYGAAALGVFNLVFSVYTLASQVSVFGVHNSVVRHVAIRDVLDDGTPTILSGALVLSLLLGSATGVVTYLLAGPYEAATRSIGVAQGLRLVAPALLLFSLNKTLMAALNGERRMRAFAGGQVVRSILMVGTVALAVTWSWDPARLPTAFLSAEVALFVYLFVPRARQIAGVQAARLGYWVRAHGSFGARGFLGGLMVEANTRIDVLMLGFFVDDATVGLYSFAAMIAVGFHNLMMVVKQNVNPVFSERWAAGARDDLHDLVRGVRRFVYPGTALLAIGAIALFPTIAGLLGEEASRDSWVVLVVLLTGIMLASGHLPFDAILVQAGHPGAHTLLTAFGALTNVLLNASLIPLLGAFGAALATSTAVCLSAVYLEVVSRRRLGFALTSRRRGRDRRPRGAG